MSEFLNGLLSVLTLPPLAEVSEAAPVIVSLIIIEGLLSVDNALAIAAMARHLPEAQQRQALRLGIIGAYLFRGLCMGFAAWIIENPWLKIGGAAYLIYLMCSHFTKNPNGEEDAEGGSSVGRGFFGTIVAIELMDLSLSVDNVIAAVALSPKLWVVCSGVFIGILALRFVAGACLKMIHRYPILEEAAFVLIGYVGFILVYELLSDPGGGVQLFPGPVHVSAGEKFLGIVLILVLSMVYSKSLAVRGILNPVFKGLHIPMKWVSQVVGAVLTVILFPVNFALKLGKASGRKSEPAVENVKSSVE
jgi:YkoY family integral membrane protein